MLVRAGHTEAGCDLAALAGLTPAAVICEIMNDDGTMARLPDLLAFAEQHGLKIGTIADLIQYRSRNEALVERAGARRCDAAGRVRLHRLSRPQPAACTWRWCAASWSAGDEVLVRVHEPLSVLDLLDAGAGATPGRCRARWQRSAPPRGVVVLLNCGAAPPTLLRAAAAAQPRRAPARRSRMDLRTYGIGAQILRDLGVAPHAAARQPAPDAEHGRLRPRSHRLRRGRRAD